MSAADRLISRWRAEGALRHHLDVVLSGVPGARVEVIFDKLIFGDVLTREAAADTLYKLLRIRAEQLAAEQRRLDAAFAEAAIAECPF